MSYNFINNNKVANMKKLLIFAIIKYSIKMFVVIKIVIKTISNTI